MELQEDFSLQCEKFKQQILNLLNSNNLPPVIKYYIIKDINYQIEKTYMEYINLQLKQQQENKKEEN